MKVINVIKDACTFLQLNNELEYINTFDEKSGSYDGTINLNIDEIRNINLLEKCFNLVLNTVLTEYIKLKDITYLNTLNGKINYDEITSFKILNIICVEDENGNKLHFSDFGNQIIVDYIGKVKVQFTYTFDELKIGDNFNFTKIPEKVLAYGVCSEFLYILKFYDDAHIWDARFKGSILNLLTNKKHLYIKPRRWF